MMNKEDFFYDATVALCAKPEYAFAREPVLRRMADGSLISTALSGGPGEPHEDNFVLSVRSEDEGKTWSKPEILFRHGERAVWVTEIFTEGVCPMMFVHTYHTPSFYREIHSYISYGSEDGKKWEMPRNIPNGLGNFSVRQGIVLSNNTWLFPVYWQAVEEGWDWIEAPAKAPDYVTMKWPTRCGVIISEDQGKSFSIYGDLRADYPLWENNVCELPDRSLLMLMRAEFSGVLYRSMSYDMGKTWSVPEPTEIPNPNSKISLCRIRNKIVLALNPAPPASKTVFSARKNLSLWVSDDGLNWNKQIPVAKPEKALFYPHLLPQDDKEMQYLMCEDGEVHYFVKIPYEAFL